MLSTSFAQNSVLQLHGILSNKCYFKKFASDSTMAEVIPFLERQGFEVKDTTIENMNQFQKSGSFCNTSFLIKSDKCCAHVIPFLNIFYSFQFRNEWND